MNNYKIKKDRGIAMGLLLSPIIFALYVDYALKGIDKEHLIIYIDDLTIILRSSYVFNKGNYQLVNEVIVKLSDVGLIIKKN